MLYAKSINTSTPFFKKSLKNHYSVTKVNHYSSHLWRLMFLITSNNVYSTITKKIYNRSTTIPFMFIGCEIFIYSGLKWLSRFITKWLIGFKFGILSWNRKRALYKSKQLKKKIKIYDLNIYYKFTGQKVFFLEENYFI